MENAFSEDALEVDAGVRWGVRIAEDGFRPEQV